MTARRPLIPAVIAAAAIATPASAQSPTLQFDRPCYMEAQPTVFSGTGWTPSGPVHLDVATGGASVAGFDTIADAQGAISGAPLATEEGLLPDARRADFTITAVDSTSSLTAAAPFTFTRWEGYSPGRYVPGRKVEVEAFGWAFAPAARLFFVFQRRGRTVASVKVGRLSEPCGDLVARFRVPRKLKPGAYRLLLAVTRRPREADIYTWRKGRVVRRASASAARRAPMLRSPHGGGGRGPW